MNLLLISLGGAIGAVARYLASETVGSITKYGFPLGTLTVNVIGCFLIGWLIGSGNAEQRTDLRLGFGVGFLGALTTFSTFSAETVKQITDGNWGVASINVVANDVLCLLAVAGGLAIGRKFRS